MKNNELVVKDNDLIDACHNLSLSEQRIILLAIVELRKAGLDPSSNETVVLKAKEYAELFGIAENTAYEELKAASLTLIKKQFKIQRNESTGKKIGSGWSNWIQDAIYQEQEGKINIAFTRSVIPLITLLEKRFTEYKIEKISKMTSTYAIHLYELLMKWKDKGRREVEIGWLQETFMITEYQNRIDNFKKKVLEIAINQINEHSDLDCYYEQRKTGRKVTHFTFIFSYKEGQNPNEVKKEKATKQAKPTKPKVATPKPATPTPVPAQVQSQPKPGYVTCKKCGLHIAEDLRQCPDCGHAKTPARVMMPEDIKALLAEARKHISGVNAAAAQPKAKPNPNPRTRDELIRELKSLGWVEPQPAV